MSHRPRKHIPLKSQLASALACLLPQAERDAYRAARVPAEVIIRLFSPDHIALHTFTADDHWSNLTPALRGPHAEKSRRDTAIAAKVKRLAAVGVRSVTPEMKRADVSSIFDGVPVATRCKHCGGDGIGCCRGRFGRKIASRPFPPKGSRPFRSVAPAQRPPPR